MKVRQEESCEVEKPSHMVILTTEDGKEHNTSNGPRDR